MPEVLLSHKMKQVWFFIPEAIQEAPYPDPILSIWSSLFKWCQRCVCIVKDWCDIQGNFDDVGDVKDGIDA